MFLPLKDENPSSSKPYMVYLLVLINVVVFLYEISLTPLDLAKLFSVYGIIPYEYTHFHDLGIPSAIPINLLTAMFLHGGWMHLIGNMLYLWIFGDNVEDAFGHFNFLKFYIISGLMASFTHIIFTPNSDVPMIGASGAISGVLGAYFILYPHARILTLVPAFFWYRLVYFRAYVYLGLWFVIQLIFSALDTGGVAWFAHIGGFVVGVIYALIYKRRKEKEMRMRQEIRFIPFEDEWDDDFF